MYFLLFVLSLVVSASAIDCLERLVSKKPRVGSGAHVCYQNYHCRISPPRFLAECRKRRPNQGSFVLLFFRLSTLSDLYLVFA